MAESNSHILPYAIQSNAPAFNVPDIQSFQTHRGAQASDYIQSRLNNLNQEYGLLLALAHDTALVYNARYNFIPRVGEIYYLYNPENPFLSLIAPEQWPARSDFLGAFKYTLDNTWQRLTPNEY